MKILIFSVAFQIALDIVLATQFAHLWVWFSLFLLKTASLVLFNSVLLGALKDIQSSKTAGHLKLFQFASGLGLIATLAGAPWVAQAWGIGVLFEFDLVLLLPCLALLFTSSQIHSLFSDHTSEITTESTLDSSSGQSELKTSVLPANILLVPASLFLCYTVFGSFNSIEAPLLKSIQLSPLQISIILGASGFGHCLGSIIVPQKFIKNVQFKHLAALQLSCIALCIVYFHCPGFVSAFATVVTVTLLNCALLLSSMAIIQKAPKPQERIRFQFLNKISSQSGVLLASLIAAAAQDLPSAKIYFECAGGLSFLVISALALKQVSVASTSNSIKKPQTLGYSANT